jgi:cytochrome c-type biogenesis protein CcmH
MLEAGKDKNEIKQFLSERYSSYILYEPPINKQNFILWFAPFIFIIVLSFVLLRRYIK